MIVPRLPNPQDIDLTIIEPQQIFENQEPFSTWGFTGKCYNCGKELEGPAIFWILPYSPLWLHILCAETLGSHLIQEFGRWDHVPKWKVGTEYVHKSEIAKLAA